MSQYVRIVPAPNPHGGPTRTEFTKIYAGDTEINGVIKLEMIAEPGGFWRAVLHMHVIAPIEVSAEAEYKEMT